MIIRGARDQGKILVAAAGNGNENVFVDGIRLDPSKYLYPAAFPEVIAVSANGDQDNLVQTLTVKDDNGNCTISKDAVYQHHDRVDLVAPGFNVGTLDFTQPNTNNYYLARGTSFSTPIVSGTIGLMLSVNPTLDHNMIVKILKNTADDIYPLNSNEYFRNGVVSANNYNKETREHEDVESWLVSPKVDLSKLDYPEIEFDFSFGDRFALTSLELYISTEYHGSCLPEDFQEWEKIYESNDFVSTTDVTSENVILSWKPKNHATVFLDDYSEQEVYFAFKFIGDNGKSITHVIDNILVAGEDANALILDENNILRCDINETNQESVCLCDDFNGETLTSNNEWEVFNTGSQPNDNSLKKWTHNVPEQFGAGRLNAEKAVKMAERYIGFSFELNQTTDACSYNEGAAEIQIDGLNGPYTLHWKNITTGAFFGTGTSKTNLTEGYYEVSITDGDSEELCPITFYIGGINPCLIDYPDGLVINNPSVDFEDLNGDGKIVVRGPVIIEENVNYSINNKTVEFLRDPFLESQADRLFPPSGIVVKEGAKLNIDGSTLKGPSECNNMWHGISVWGDEPITISTGKPTGRMAESDEVGSTAVEVSRGGNTVNSSKKELKNNSIQGRLLGLGIKNGKLEITNSTIRDAYIGVSLYRNPPPFNEEAVEYGRGEIDAANVSFINNEISIDFKGFSLVNNASKIYNCDFIHDDNLKDKNYSESGAIRSFISIRNVKGPEITANSFTGNLDFPVDQRGTGIFSFDASYIVESNQVGFSGVIEPNIFSNLSKGIDIYATGGITSIKIKDNRFNNVYQGITANGSNFEEISFNRFDVPLGTVDFNSWGMFMQTSAGFLATENIVEANAANNYTFGAVARNVTNVNGEYYKNTFEGAFSVATQIEGMDNINNQLTIDCNSYNSTNTFDWAVLSDNIANQGECDPADALISATNLFNECNSNDDSNIFSEIVFQYSSLPLYAPDCVSNEVFAELCQIPSQSFEDLCPQVAFYCPSCVAELEGDFGNLPNGIIRKKVRGELYRRLAQSGDIDKLVSTLTEESLPEDRKILIPTHWQRKRFQEARQELNELPIETDADTDFYKMFDVLVSMGENERLLHEITEGEEQIIRDVAEAQNETSVLAESVLAQLTKTGYVRFPEQLPLGAKSLINDDEKEARDKNENIKIYPNPSKSDVTVEFEEAKQVIGQLYDGMGRLIRTFETNGEQTIYTVTGLSHGIYNLRLIDTNNNIETKRIIIR